MSEVTKSWTKCDVCGIQIDSDCLKNWRWIAYDLDGNVWPGIDICSECLTPTKREQTARKIGAIIMESIEAELGGDK